MSKMIERVGRVICSIAAEPSEDDYDLDKVFWDRIARAAIEAMREPSGSVVAAVKGTVGYAAACDCAEDCDWADAWREGIDAALKP